MTVSRVVRGRRHQVNEDTYNRVVEAMRELNYVPVRSSVQNHHVETNVLALVPYYRNPTMTRIDNSTYRGVCENASQSGYDLFVMLRGEAEWMANREEVRFLDRRSDGFIFISPGTGEWQVALESLVQHEIPAVVCYRRDVPEGVAWVDADNERIIQLAVDCLVRQGHRDIIYLGGPSELGIDANLLANVSGTRRNYDDTARWHYFEQTMYGLAASCGATARSRRSDPSWHLSDEDVNAVLTSGATGVVCLNDHLALELWDRVEAAGLSIPRDLSIVGVDGHDEAAKRGLTSVTLSYEEVGRKAVEAWLRLLAGETAADCCYTIPVELVERTSVAPPASGRSR